ncbi:hypothetical protein BSKO_03762 [Bryopsis sp. KO-2023]|nr:hypothetical protein BSKO_03762 [Bryopsis sp. KO-2023]
MASGIPNATFGAKWAKTTCLRCPVVSSTFRVGKVSKTRLVTRANNESSDSFSGEWPMAWSLASYEDLGEYYERQLFKEEGMGGHFLADVMSTDLYTVRPDDTVESVGKLFEDHTGLPVLDDDNRLIGVVSRRDVKEKPVTTKVSECMSSPPIAAKPTSTVADAACLMLKHKIHRIPIVDKSAKVIGMVTRTDIFTALEAETSVPS